MKDLFYKNFKTGETVKLDREDEDDDWAYWKIKIKDETLKYFDYFGTTPKYQRNEIENNQDWSQFNFKCWPRI